MSSFNIFILVIFVLFSGINCRSSPNIILLLTDDQDLTLGGMIPMVNTQLFVGEYGAEFQNMFVTTPLCCPSRASILTGKYAHSHNVRNNSVSGNCNSVSWQQTHEQKSFITHLKKAGYSTFYAGKYLNQYGTKASGGVKHVPPGWDSWIGLVGNSCYYNFTLSVNGRRVKHGSDPDKDYLTDLIFREGVKFLDNQNGTSPFLMFLSPPAPHAPFTPFPKYKEKFGNFSAPRTPNFNVAGGKSKHWLLRQPPNPLPETVIQNIDEVFRNRLRTLISVDEGIYQLFSKLKKKKILHDTYIFFTSDNGFHLGQFSLPWDKRQPYEFDVRVPLLVRGPGVPAGLKIKDPVLNIDLAPTFLDLAKIPIPEDFDGESFADLLRGSSCGESGRSHFIIEHQGEASDRPIPGCPQYKTKEVHTCEVDCICEDSHNNTYVCERHLTNTKNLLICLFEDDQHFAEAYNITEDPYQLRNVFPQFQANLFQIKK